MVGPAKDRRQAPTNKLKLYTRADIESEAWPTIMKAENGAVN